MGSSFSNPLERHILRVGVFDMVSRNHQRWQSEFGQEYALVYSAWDTKPGICTTCCSERLDKVIYTFYDAFCEDSLVAVNVEFVEVRDGHGRYKLDATKVKEFGENFTERTRGSMEAGLLFLSYVISCDQLSFHRRGGKYEIVFRSESPLVILEHSMRISCDPWSGLTVDARFPFRFYGEKLHSLPMSYDIYPPEDFKLEGVNDIRSQLKEDAGSAISHPNNTNRPSLSYSQNDVVLNAGQTQGLLCGANLRDCQIYIEGSRFQFKDSQNL